MSDEIEYLDFEINVQKAGDNQYVVRAKSGDDEAETYFTNPFNEDKRALISATLTKVALRSSAKTRSSSAPEVKKMKEVGALLFDNAIAGPVREFFYKCQGQADNDSKGIRWRLSLDSTVGDLPWEFMYLQDQFLALNPRTPVVRYIKGAARVAPLKSEHPLRLLVVIASPSDEIPLDTVAEKERITAALKTLIDQGMVDVTYIEGPETWDRLTEALLPNRTHILHFIGHGSFDEDQGEGVLIMEDSQRKGTRIDSERLRVLVQGKSRLRLVVLNSCLGTEGSDSQPFSSMAAGLLRSGIPAVIAMQFEISDDAAKKIAQTFYTSLALNMPVDAALTEARRKIFFSDRDSLEWATPILYMQIPNGQLFEFDLEAAKSDGIDTSPPTPDRSPVVDPSTLDAVAVLVPTEGGEDIPLEKKVVKVGRDPASDIALSEIVVSRKHATLTRTGSSYTIENQGKSGTFVNDKFIAGPTLLKDKDIVRFGGVEFEFHTLARGKPDAPRKPVTAKSETPSGKDALESMAEKRYQEGQAAMAAEDWATAAKAFGGALRFLPDYKDAEENLSLCEKREKVQSLYTQAQGFFEQKNYFQALQTLDQAARVDPQFADPANIRMRSECGQNYGRALGQLQNGNRDAAAGLLREVIKCQPDFEDAALRLENLAAGGDGLLDIGVPRIPQPAQPAPAPQLSFRLYEVDKPDLKQLAETLRQCFFIKGLESQIVQQGESFIVQGKKSGLVVYLGMGLAATVMIEPQGANLKISIGGGKWLEQGAAMAAGLWLLVPLFTGAWGMAQQKQLIDELWRLAENFVVTAGGHRIQ